MLRMAEPVPPDAQNESLPGNPIARDELKSRLSKPAPQKDQTNVRETVESILVAFILAFIFRAFVVEAFVIPTGSMAPTLLGAHMRFYCPDCGYKFAMNYSSPSSGDDDVVVPAVAEGVDEVVGQRRGDDGKVYNVTRHAARVFPIHCPNCGYKLPETDGKDPDNDGTSPPVNHGDRILVLKYLYLVNEPQRWDVVVFKSPVDPAKFDYSQNYIKRLVGRPNETIMILDGDVYVAANASATDDRGFSADAAFKVQRKPTDVQDALWRVVYDNDFHPRADKQLSRDRDWNQPWRPVQDAPGWSQDADAGRTFTFDSPQSAATLQFDPAVANEVFPLYDFTGYNQIANFGDAIKARGNVWGLKLPHPRNVVEDLRLAVTYTRKSGDGPLRLRLSKGDDLFTAECLPDRVRLLRSTTNGANATTVGEVSMNWGSRPTRVELQNVDYRASVIIDGKELLATGDEYAPDVATLRNGGRGPKALPVVQIVAADQHCDVSHVGLFRDTYYLNVSSGTPLRWGSPESPIVLGPDEYFVCGDNSELSFDGRFWKQPIDLPGENLHVQDGRVPGRFMLGKAFFVYWPAGYRPIKALPGLAPNFGQMRFIH